MNRVPNQIDRTFLVLTCSLIGVGLLSFFSGAFFLFAENSTIFWGTIIRHVGFGLLGGLIGYFIYTFLDTKSIQKLSPMIAIVSILLTALVFVPGIGTTLGTFAKRWISIAGVTIQPAEFMKIGAVLGSAWWFSTRREHLSTFLKGAVPLWIILGAIGVLLLLQPDTDGFLIIAMTLVALYFFAEASLKHIALNVLIFVILGGGLVYSRPYLRNRIDTFINPSQDVLGNSYQVRQSLVAIGAGEITGRGYGRGIHKYDYLPEPMGDSIFAVIGEEWGVIGTSLVVILFFLWYVRSLVLASRVTSFFARFSLFGFAHIIIIQAYINILSNIGLFPFSGLPLPFMSQGGTAFFVFIVIIGFMLALSKPKIHKIADEQKTIK